MSRQFSKPSPCFTIHRHHSNQSRRECPHKQLMVFCQKNLCKSVQKAILSLPKGGPPRDSQTGCFPRNSWPPKCQLRSRKTQFKLKLSHDVIVIETKNLQPQLFHLQSASALYVLEKVLDYFALIRFQGTLRCQESSPNQALASRSTHITATNHVGNVHKKHLRKFLVKVFRNLFFLSQVTAKLDGFQESSGH